jgi:hypothetical protein
MHDWKSLTAPAHVLPLIHTLSRRKRTLRAVFSALLASILHGILAL